MKSDLHQTFRICSWCSSKVILIPRVVHMHACTHSAWKCSCILYKFELCLSVCVCHIFVTIVTHLNISAKWSQIFRKLSAYFRIDLLSWLIMFIGMRVCMHSAWKCACYLGQNTNPHISAKWSQIVMKLSMIIKDAQKNLGAKRAHTRSQCA